ncbi:hypothetical protein BGW36DRAFT_255991, partial [Talaromyces proteolyticus]
MPSVAVEEPQLISPVAALHKAPPRSAGASSRAKRSENISELVRFFQAQQGTQEDEMNIMKHDGAMDFLKAGQRRLRQLGQAKPDKRIKGTESPVPSEKGKAKRQHLLALQREGLLPSTDDALDTSRPSRTRRDVEAMGRPWLDDAYPGSNPKDDGSSTSDSLNHLRCESLGLGDLAALVEFSVSFPDYYSEEPGPPPYQAQAQSSSGPAPTNISQATSSEERDQDKATVNDDSRPQESLMGRQGRDSRTGEARPALSQLVQAPALSTSKTVDRPAQNDEHNRGQGDRCCERNYDCDCDDAKSLAVLLRVTERLGREKKAVRNSTPPPNEAGSVSAAGNISGEYLPHSLNQGVTDTPLFVKAPAAAIKHGQAEERKRISNSNNAFRETPSLLFPSQGESSLSKSHSVGPIPLKLVAECLPPRGSSSVASKSASPQFQFRQNNSLNLLQPPQESNTPTASNFPRPQTLLSPFPGQSRRARSVTPDVASSSQGRKKKKPRISPLYVVNAAPLPPPTKPLPSVPQSTDVNAPLPAADEERKMSTPIVTPAPDQPGEKCDSPTLGSAMHKPRLRRSLIGPRPPSRYSIRSNDTSEAIYTASDDHSIKTISPAPSSLEALEEVRRGRADKVRAIRMRDLGTKKDQKPTVEPESQYEAKIPKSSTERVHADTVGQAEKPKRDRKHRASAAPKIPLPNDPPVVAYDTQRNRRRGSTSSLPGSISTINGYGGGLSRSVSITSGSIAGSPILRGRLVHTAEKPPKNTRHGRTNSPTLPSSDDERPKPQTRHSQTRMETGVDENWTHHHARRSDTRRDVSDIEHPPRHPDRGQASPRTPRSHSVLQSRHSYAGQMQSIHYLEARVATLERQNKMLQAALLAALDVGVSHDAESIRSGATSPALDSARIPTISETSMPSPSRMSINETHKSRKMSAQKHHATQSHHSWASGQDHNSQDSRGSFETSGSHSDTSLRAVESLLSDVDV